MSGYRPPRFSGLGAHVSGMSAWVLVDLLERSKALDTIRRMPPGPGAEVLQTYDALRAAAIYWNQSREEPQVSERPAVRAAVVTETAEELSASEAAARLGCSDRRIRQLVTEGKLVGRLTARRWHIDASSVEDYLLAKDVA